MTIRHVLKNLQSQPRRYLRFPLGVRLASSTTITVSIPAHDLSIRLVGLLHQLQVCSRGVVDKPASLWG